MAGEDKARIRTHETAHGHPNSEKRTSKGMAINARAVAAIPGWFSVLDQLLFDWFLETQSEQGVVGDLAEMGVYMGKSAVIIGAHLQPEERFTVVDLFGLPASDTANQLENSGSYPELTQQAFETYYLGIHQSLPIVVRGYSHEIADHAREDSHRFIHIDASHLYEHVKVDIQVARKLLSEDGIVVFDDIRSPHTPGLVAAVWEAVVTAGLVPIAVSVEKLYATWGSSSAWTEGLIDWVSQSSTLEYEVQKVMGRDLVIVKEQRRGSPALRAVAQQLPMPIRSRAAALYLKFQARR